MDGAPPGPKTDRDHLSFCRFKGPDCLPLDDLYWCLDLGSLIHWASRALISLDSFSAISLMVSTLHDCLHVDKFLLFGVEFIPLFDQIKPFVH